MKLLPMIFLAGLAGCSNEATHDVAYYLEKPNERGAKITECANNPGEKALMANCINARQAEYKAMFSSKQMATF